MKGAPMFSVDVGKVPLTYKNGLCFAGAACELRTNSAELARILELLSIPIVDRESIGFNMRIVVDESSCDPLREAHFRGMHHVVTASFGSSNLFVFDVARRTLSASVSGVAACDYQFWKEKLIPITLGVLGCAIGLVPVHCACLVSGGDGLLIGGSSGAGKSTLSIALAKSGFRYLSDDWTYISRRRATIVAHGTSAPVKLLPDATAHFEVLRDRRLRTSMNGELAYELDAEEAFSVHVERECEPRWFILLERMLPSGVEFTPLSSAECRSYVTSCIETLPAQLHEASAIRSETIDRVALLPCWRFRYGGTPQFAARELHKFVQHCRQEEYV
jgi:hypothetical protein